MSARCLENPSEEDDNPDQGGRPTDKYYLTTHAFEHFAMTAATETGDRVRRFFRAIRDAYIELTQRLRSNTDREQAYILTHDMKKCLYVGVIQQQPQRLCKFGHTADIKSRYRAHKHTFKPPYFFELLHVVEADDAKKAEDIFRKVPDIKDNRCPVKIGGSIQQETFVMPEMLTEERCTTSCGKHAAGQLQRTLSWQMPTTIPWRLSERRRSN